MQRFLSVAKWGSLLVVGWTVFGFLSSVHFLSKDYDVTNVRTFLEVSGYVMVFYWGWVLVTPPVVYVAFRTALNRAPRLWNLLVLAATALAVTVVHGIIYIGLLQLLQIDTSMHIDSDGLSKYLVRHAGGDLATFAVIVGVCFLVAANRRARERELAAAAAEARLVTADLELLRWHLHPHFLFNALNTVSTLVLKGQNDRAESAIALISRYLRSALEQRADSTVSVDAELATVQRYVEIEKLRFGDLMRIELEVSEAAREARLPSQLVQPLIENAIMHGAVREPGADPIRIGVTVDNGRLVVKVSNPASEPVRNEGERFGLKYVRGRLRQFYGDDGKFELVTRSGLTTATLDLPYAQAIV
jgi:sensor histidine kinase YesM